MVAEDIAPVGIARVGAALAGLVGLGRTELLPDRIRLLRDADDVVQGLAHFRRAVDPHDPGAAADEGRRLGKVVTEAAVEAAGDLPAELQVLGLVLPDRHGVGLVDEDVRGLEDGIVEQAGRDVLTLPLGFLLELGHPAELTEGRHAIEEPAELGVLGDVALDEDRALRGVEPGGHVVEGGVPNPLGQELRVVRDGDRVEVDDGKEAVVVVHQADPVLDSAEIVADMDRAARLDAAQDTLAWTHSRTSFQAHCITGGPTVRPGPWRWPPRSCVPGTHKKGPRRPGRRSARFPGGRSRDRTDGRPGPR